MDSVQSRQNHINQCRQQAQEYFQQRRMNVEYIHAKSPNVVVRPTKQDIKSIRALFSIYPKMTDKQYGNYLRASGLEATKEKLALFRTVRSLVQTKTSAFRGVVLTFEENGETKIGWSLCNPRDSFESHEGIRKAINRAIPIDNMLLNIERSKEILEKKAKPVADEFCVPHTCIPYLNNAIRKAKNRSQKSEV